MRRFCPLQFAVDRPKSVYAENVPYTRVEMVTEAHRAGFQRVSARLVTDWASVGLLAHPTRVARPAGQGRGALYTWSNPQKDLFLTELHHRPGGKDIQRLLNVPVAVWLYWGEQWGVELPQVRVALKNWAASEYDRSGTEDRVLSQARLTVNNLAAPNATREDKRLLREALVKALRKREWDQDKITRLAIPVADPSRSGRTIGPFATSVETLLRFLPAFLRGLQALDSATNDLLINARAQRRDLTIEYARDWLRNVTDPAFGPMFEHPTVQFFVNNACRDLVREVGAIEISGYLPPLVAPWTNLPDVLRTHVHQPLRTPGN